MEQKLGSGAPPPATSNGPLPFDPLDIAEGLPLDAIDEATSARLRDEAWKESMIAMNW